MSRCTDLKEQCDEIRHAYKVLECTIVAYSNQRCLYSLIALFLKRYFVSFQQYQLPAGRVTVGSLREYSHQNSKTVSILRKLPDEISEFSTRTHLCLPRPGLLLQEFLKGIVPRDF
jgi:hypothetical protein